jgi:hypothetical protein
MSFANPMFTGDFEYPPEACVDTPTMMPLPPEDAAARRPLDEHDGRLVYVSHVSEPPERIAPAMLERVPDEMHGPVSAIAQALIRLYQSGGSIPTHRDLRLFIEREARRLGLSVRKPGVLQQLGELFWNPLNIACYRQQALGWAQTLADELGLELAVYGRGWENHPRFARHARGCVEPGEPLNELIRGAFVNLCLEPYASVTHSRLVNGLMNGGFQLIREHPVDRCLPPLSALLETAAPEAETTHAALRDAPASVKPELARLIERARGAAFAADGDPIPQLLAWRRSGVIAPDHVMLPRADEVTFAGPDDLRRRLRRLLDQPELRSRLATEQGEHVIDRLSLVRGLDRVLDRLRSRLAETPRPEPAAA